MTIKFKQMKKGLVLSTIILLIMFLVFIANSAVSVNILRTITASGIKNLPSAIKGAENLFNSQFSNKSFYIDLNSLFLKAINKHEMNGVTRDNSDHLHIVNTGIPDTLTIKKDSQSILTLFEYARKNNIKFIFVQAPAKVIEGQTVLPVGIRDSTNEIYDLWRGIMAENQIPVVDLRESLKDSIDFYKTDHHWTTTTSMHAAESIIESLNANYNSGITPYWTPSNGPQYKKMVWAKSFLGSYGIKVGRFFYSGKDDFEMYVPTFKTNIEYTHYMNGKIEKKKIGSFEKAFLDYEILDDPNYKNKYNACLFGGYVENVIINHYAANNTKVLLVTDSFGRSMSQYLSLYFKELRYLDPQKGRYNDSYIKYMDRYKPEIVIVMYNSSISL